METHGVALRAMGSSGSSERTAREREREALTASSIERSCEAGKIGSDQIRSGRVRRPKQIWAGRCGKVESADRKDQVAVWAQAREVADGFSSDEVILGEKAYVRPGAPARLRGGGLARALPPLQGAMAPRAAPVRVHGPHVVYAQAHGMRSWCAWHTRCAYRRQRKVGRVERDGRVTCQRGVQPQKWRNECEGALR